jgi:putative transposase of IS4/5 family DUF4096
MGSIEVTDELWERIHPVLPVVQRRRRWPGRRRMDNRACLNGILFVLITGIGWERLPQQLGYGSGMTCWGGCATGRPQGYGTNCMSCCSLTCALPADSTWPVRSPTPPMCAPSKGGGDRA